MSMLVVAAVAFEASAYEVSTHRMLSGRAFARSILAGDDSPALRYLGLHEVAAGGALPGQAGDRTAIDHVGDGAVAEDGVFRFSSRPSNHFFDPYNGRAVCALCYTSPQWALEMFQDIVGQGSSLRHMREFFRDGLRLQQPGARAEELGKLFRALGHVIHHVQDMAQPQHARADAHFPFIPWEYSKYEKYVGGCDQKILETVGDDYPIPTTFADALSFWNTKLEGIQATGGQGLAEFTNQNFISQDTNFEGSVNYVTNVVTTAPQDPLLPLPDANGTTLETVPVQNLSLDCGAFPFIPSSALNGKEVGFVKTLVSDTLTGQSVLNRTSTLGLLAADVAQTPECASHPSNCPATFGESVYTFEAYAKLLLPRAVAYSAGLINHFFSGVVRQDGTPALRLKASRLTNEDGTLTITNASGRTLQSGTFSVYYDDRLTGLREPAGSVALAGPLAPDIDFVITQGEPGQGVQLSKLWIDADAAGQVAVVFEGVAGNAPNEEEEIVAARVCDCESFLMDPLDPALRDCSGVCPCTWLDFVDGSPGIPGDGLAVAGVVVNPNGEKRFTFPDCMQGSGFTEDATVTVFATNPTIGVDDSVVLQATVDDVECSLGICGGGGGSSGGVSQVQGETNVNSVPGWYANYHRTSGTTPCEGEPRPIDDLHDVIVCFTNESSCPILATGCCDQTVNLDAAMICFQPNTFPANAPLP